MTELAERERFEPSVQVLARTTVKQKDRSRRPHSYSRTYSRTRCLQVGLRASHSAVIVLHFVLRRAVALVGKKYFPPLAAPTHFPSTPKGLVRWPSATK